MRQAKFLVIELLFLAVMACKGKTGKLPPAAISTGISSPPSGAAANQPDATAVQTIQPAALSSVTATPSPYQKTDTPIPPTATPTRRPPQKTRTRPPTVTRTPVPTVPTVPNILSWFDEQPPAYASEVYRLRPWTETVSRVLLQLAVNEKNSSLSDEPWWYINFAYIFQYEWLIRSPQSSEWINGPWNATNLDFLKLPFPGSANNESAFAYIVETEANAAQGDAAQIMDKLRSFGFIGNDPVLVKDLFGPNQNGAVFELKSTPLYSGPGMTLFYLRPTSAGYQLETLLDWDVTGDEYPSIEIHPDENKNGFPEIYLYYKFGPTADGYCSEPLSIYEWNGQTFAERLHRAMVLDSNNSASNCTGSWRLQPTAGAGIPDLITSETRHTFTDCPDLPIERTHRWNGQQYQLVSTDYLPLEDDRLECRVYRAVTVSGDYPQLNS